jgi:hypothetical protein
MSHIPAGWRPETLLFISRLLFYTAEHFLITTSHGPRRKHNLYYWSVFTGQLHSNGHGADNIGNTFSALLRRVYSGYVFTESLPSNWYTRHNIKILKYIIINHIKYYQLTIALCATAYGITEGVRLQRTWGLNRTLPSHSWGEQQPKLFLSTRTVTNLDATKRREENK